MDYTTRELTKEEGDELTKDMNALLEKHGAEVGVVASLQFLKREEVKQEFIVNPNGDSTTEEDTHPNEAR